jgi:branched-chain amino acid transport system substrate-binding protein
MVFPRAKTVNGDGPFRAGSYEAGALIALAMQAAGFTDRAAIAANIMKVANAPGDKIMPGEIAKGLEILANGGEIDYVGASNVEFTDIGEATGSYKELEVDGKKFKTITVR